MLWRTGEQNVQSQSVAVVRSGQQLCDQGSVGVGTFLQGCSQAVLEAGAWCWCCLCAGLDLPPAGPHPAPPTALGACAEPRERSRAGRRGV